MKKLLESKLPEKQEYWDRLAGRISQDGARVIAGYPRACDTWWWVLSGRAGWLTPLSAAALILLALALPRTPNPASGEFVEYSWVEESVMPKESNGALLSRAQPPNVTALLTEFAPGMGDHK